MGGKGRKRNLGQTPVYTSKRIKQIVKKQDQKERGDVILDTTDRNEKEDEVEGEIIEPGGEQDQRTEVPVATFDDVIDTSVPVSGTSTENRKVVVVLEEACLETVKTKTGKYELLNCDDHLSLHSKIKRDPKHSRPDIAHQCLLTLLDSPLNKAGFLTVYLRSAAGVLIEISPQIRIPRTYKRFAGLMVQLLHDNRIRASQGSQTLLKVIKNPVTLHLPVNARKFGTSVQGTLVDVYEFVNHLPNNEPVVFVFGAMAQGKLNPDYVENFLSFSKYPLSGSYALGRLLGAFEKKWGIV